MTPPLVNMRDRVRDIFKSSRALNNQPQPLTTGEARDRLILKYSEAVVSLSSVIHKLVNSNELRVVTKGVFVWNENGAAKPRPIKRGLFPPAALSPRHKIIPQQSFDMDTRRVVHELWLQYGLRIDRRAVAALANAGWLPARQNAANGKFRFPKRVLQQLSTMAQEGGYFDPDSKARMLSQMRKPPKRAPRNLHG